MKKTYVIDTNILIQAPHAFLCFEENDVVLPLVVVEELDGLKKADGEKGSNARKVVRMLEQYRNQGDLLQGVTLPDGGTLRIEKNYKAVELPEDMPEDNPQVAGPHEPGRGHIIQVSLLGHLPPHHPGKGGDEQNAQN